MSFPLGRPILIMAIAACVSGVAILTRPARPPADLTVWVFAESHAKSFRGDAATTQPTLIELYREQTGQSVDVKLVNTQALNVRLNAIFDRGQTGEQVPDLVEIEIGSVGRYFRANVDQIGFLPLNDRLKRDALTDRLLAARLAPWTKDGVIFGVPLDVHPVSITYRRDLFDEAGVDLASATTWPAFVNACVAYQAYWSRNGHPERRAFEMPRAAVDTLDTMLLQQRVSLTDAFAHAKTPATVAFYARTATRVGGSPAPAPETGFQEIAGGEIGAMLTPDWRASALADSRPELAGKLAMMPLPRFAPTDARTATRGGTMVAIPRHVRDPERAWQLLKHLYFSPEGLAAQRQHTGILPPFKVAWDHPAWHRPNPFFGGQRIGELYIELARELPEQKITPFTPLAQQAMAVVLSRAVTAAERGDADLDAQIVRWLVEADAEVRKRVEFGRFE